MPATLIDGKAQAATLRAEVAKVASDLAARAGATPGLAVVLVGEDAASAVYVGAKLKATRAAGLASYEHRLPADTSEAELMALVHRLNADPAVHGILVQLPLPPQILAAAVIGTIDPAKDVDGFHVENVGRLSAGLPALVPCTPLGCMRLIRVALGEKVAGAEAVVVGRSPIVGKPMAQLLLAADCTVTVAHSKSRDLPALCHRADILIAAAGRPEFVRGDWVKPGACVIDVGINRINIAEPGAARIVGDVAFDEVAAIAGQITPVPGGVGPMTIAMLLANTTIAFAARHGLDRPRYA